MLSNNLDTRPYFLSEGCFFSLGKDADPGLHEVDYGKKRLAGGKDKSSFAFDKATLNLYFLYILYTFADLAKRDDGKRMSEMSNQ